MQPVPHAAGRWSPRTPGGDDNHVELLERAAGLSEPEVRALVTRMRVKAPSEELPGLVATPVAAAVAVTSPGENEVARATSAGAAALKEAIVLTLRVGEEFREELARVRELASHSVPSGKAEEVLLHVLRAYRKRQEHRRFGAKHARDEGAPPRPEYTPRQEAPPRLPTDGTRYVKAHVRREVYDREQGTCAYVGPEGKRCGSTWQLEYQHNVPFARGGQSTADNGTIYCKAHNLLQAEKDFGAAHVAAKKRERRKSGGGSRHAQDVTAALKNLGFGKKEAREAALQAIGRVPKESDLVTA